MIFFNSTSLDPYFNLACEEFLMRNTQDDVFMLWQNDKTIVIGKNQNTLSEINSDFVKENNINVVRRLSGGGAVYHDKGNINFTFIKTSEELFSDYKAFTEPVTAFLLSLGVSAELSGRNDILVNGKKVSGNAQYMKNGRVLHHGTLLFSSPADIISKALNADMEKISSKGIKSVKSRVTNISEHLDFPMTAEEFKNKLSAFVIGLNSDCVEYIPTDDDLRKIESLKNEKYMTWEWNYGYSPKYDYCRKKRFPFGGVEVNLHIGSDGIIENAKIYGDFFSSLSLDNLCAVLIGNKHNKKDIKKALSNISVKNYISGMENEEFIELLF